MVSFALALALLGQTSAPSTAPGVELPKEIRDALVQSAEQIGPISIEFTMQSSSTYTVKEAREKLKLDEWYAACNAGAREEFKLSWQAGKYRSWFQDGRWPEKPEHAADLTLEGAFDGETMYLGSLGDLDPDPHSILFKVPLEFTPSSHYKLDNRGWTHGTWYFDHAGWRMPVSIGDLKDSRPPRAQLLHMLDEGAKVAAVSDVEIEGQKLVRVDVIAEDPDRKWAEATDPEEMIKKLRKMGALETEEQLQARADNVRKERELPRYRQYRFFLDPSRAYALRRYEERYDEGKDGTLLRRTDCLDFKQVAQRKLHLPGRCIQSEYVSLMMPGTYFPEPVVTRTFELTELDIRPIEEGKFSLSYMKPGNEIIEILDREGGRRELIANDDGTVRERNR